MGPQDWEQVTHNESLPYTCCPDVHNDGSCTQNTKDKYNASCLEKVKDKVISSSTIIGGVGIAVGLIQVYKKHWNVHETCGTIFVITFKDNDVCFLLKKAFLNYVSL